MAKSLERCNGCGRFIGLKEQTRRVGSGEMRRAGYHEEKQWGIFHQSCFNRNFDSPVSTREEMERLRDAG